MYATLPGRIWVIPKTIADRITNVTSSDAIRLIVSDNTPFSRGTWPSN
jgi:hypothetical protein